MVDILLRELINSIFNEIRHATYVLLYTTKNIYKHSKNSSKTRRYSAITTVSTCNNTSIIARLYGIFEIVVGEKKSYKYIIIIIIVDNEKILF